jgi:hypothetical protein
MSFAVLTCGCALHQSQFQGKPIGENGSNVPSGTLEVLMDVKVDSFNNVRAALATFRAFFAGFPRGTNLTSAQIHAGVMGSAGPVVVDLGLEPGAVTLPDGTGSFITTVPVPSAVASQIVSDASAFYFQVDTAHIPGVLRGQLEKVVVTYSSADSDPRIKRYRSPTSGELWGEP